MNNNTNNGKFKVAEFHGAERAEMVRYFECGQKANEDVEGRMKRMSERFEGKLEFDEVKEEEKMLDYIRVVHVYYNVDKEQKCSKITMKKV